MKTQQKFKFDVFISFNSSADTYYKDNKKHSISWELYEVLKGQGLDVFHSERKDICLDIQSSAEKMQYAIENSKSMLLLLSDQGFGKCQKEDEYQPFSMLKEDGRIIYPVIISKDLKNETIKKLYGIKVQELNNRLMFYGKNDSENDTRTLNFIALELEKSNEEIIDKEKDVKKTSKSLNEVNIVGEWLSTFAEEGKLKNESVVFTSVDSNNIEGIFTILSDKEEIKYQFNGTFKNRTLIGTYHNNEEHGIINLIYISSELLFGYCNIIDRERTIYSTPYVLTKIENGLSFNDKKERVRDIYDFCKDCYGKCGNCCNGDNVDLPILLPFERELIVQEQELDSDEFCKPYKESVIYQMKPIKNGGCYFYKDNKCSIYDYRPLDCKLFPFDYIINNDGEFELVLYKQVCKKGINLPIFDKRKNEYYYYLLQPLFHIIKPYMVAFLEKPLNIKLNSITPIKLKMNPTK